MFHSFFNFLARSRYLSFFSLFFSFILWSARPAKSTVCMSKFQRSLCVSFYRRDIGLSIYRLFVGSNLDFLHNSQGIILPTQSCLVLYSFCTNLLYSLILWLMVSSLSPHNLHLLLCCVLSILALIWLVLIALFCAAIRRDSVSFLRFPFLCHIHVFSFYKSLISCLKRPRIVFLSIFVFCLLSFR